MASERQANIEISPWWGEHVQRYEVVERALTASDTVLDIACGTGYGTSRLSERTQRKVIGGDVSAEAVAECRRSWAARGNAEFRVLDGTRLDFPDATFEKVVSFETIEHTRDYERMLSEFNRVLKPGGAVFISTPNLPVNSPGGVVTNPYHTQEFVLEEFEALMRKHFSAPKIFGQKYVRYDRKRGTRAALAKAAEKFFYLRGVRKLPLSLRDAVMRALIGKPLYPEADDFVLVEGESEIRRCKTFFAIAGKR